MPLVFHRWLLTLLFVTLCYFQLVFAESSQAVKKRFGRFTYIIEVSQNFTPTQTLRELLEGLANNQGAELDKIRPSPTSNWYYARFHLPAKVHPKEFAKFLERSPWILSATPAEN